MQQTEKLPSERSFGFLFAGVFLLLALWPWAVHGKAPVTWALCVAAVFFACALIRPRLLYSLNWLWYRFGLLLHAVANPILMALIYFGAVVPIGMLMRMKGRDLLRLKRNPGSNTYWIPRVPPSPKPGSMAKQF
jgi:hypothetical protein